MSKCKSDTDCLRLKHAARLALRGHGNVEPNPMVGCVIVDINGTVVGCGYHKRFGEAHAEVNALKEAGNKAKGGTAYVTLEPCNHHGKTPPCSEALIKAGISKAVISSADSGEGKGGAERLREAGVEVEFNTCCTFAKRIAQPFLYRLKTGLPWVIAKWAQTMEGRIIPIEDDSQWISSDSSRRMVHRERGRVDAILTAIGTVLADNPTLNARNVRTRRVARRIIVDPLLQTPLESKIVSTASSIPTTILTTCKTIDNEKTKTQDLKNTGIDILNFETNGNEIAMNVALSEVATKYDITNILVEAGPSMLERLFKQKLVNLAWVFVGGTTRDALCGDFEAKSTIGGIHTDRLINSVEMNLLSNHQRGNDVVLIYSVD